MTFKEWYKRADGAEVGTSEDGNFQVTRLPDSQYVVWYRKPPNQPGKVWTWVTDSAGNRREFDTLDEAAEEAAKQRGELLRRLASLPTGYA
jgi:hypothetical protein